MMDNRTGNVPELAAGNLQQGSGDNLEVSRHETTGTLSSLVQAENSDLESRNGGVVVVQWQQARNLLQQSQQIHSSTLVSEDATEVRNITVSQETETMTRNQNSEGDTQWVVELSAEKPYEAYSEKPRPSRHCAECDGISHDLSPNLVKIKKVLFEILNTPQQCEELKEQIKYWYGVELGFLGPMLKALVCGNNHHIGGKCLVSFLCDAVHHIGGQDLVHVLVGVLSGQGDQNTTDLPLANSAGAFVSVPDSLDKQLSRSGPSFKKYRDKSRYECCICDKCLDAEPTDCMTLPCSHKVHKECLVQNELPKCVTCRLSVFCKCVLAGDNGIVAAQFGPNLFGIFEMVLFEILNTSQQREELKDQIKIWYGVKLGWFDGMLMELMYRNHIGGRCFVCFLYDALVHIGGNDLVHVLDDKLSGNNKLLASLGQGDQTNEWENVNVPHNTTALPSSNSAGAFFQLPDLLSEQQSGSEQIGPPFERYRDKSGHECCVCDERFDAESTDYITLPCSHKAHTKCFDGGVTNCPHKTP